MAGFSAVLLRSAGCGSTWHVASGTLHSVLTREQTGAVSGLLENAFDLTGPLNRRQEFPRSADPIWTRGHNAFAVNSFTRLPKKSGRWESQQYAAQTSPKGREQLLCRRGYGDKAGAGTDSGT